MARTVSMLASPCGAGSGASSMAVSGAKRAMRSVCSLAAASVAAGLERSMRVASLDRRPRSAGGPAVGRAVDALVATAGPLCRKSAFTATPVVTNKKLNSAIRACPGVIVATPALAPVVR